MAFDKDTRNKLARLVADCRRLLTDEFLRQCQGTYGIQPDGSIASLDSLARLDDRELSVARQLRERIAYLASNEAGEYSVPVAIERMVREQAFTVMNRLAAMRMAEARSLIVESVSKGMDSQGFEMYDQITGPAMGEKYERYCCFLFSMFDEIAIDLGSLFDRYSPYGLLFPYETALLELLKLINQKELSVIWAEDETIGWIYQYYNDPDERKKMRKESAAPRNSRELAVRNQFFTPRYVVEFLTDNTLGRIWYEMTRGQTRLADQCRYLVRRPTEIFLAEGETAPETPEQEGLSQEELLKQPVHIPHRPLKDPREIRLLDPACGSMHFGLYAFDLFETIYVEAWVNGTCPALQDAYPSKDEFLNDVPRLIIEHNIHGVDIDPRAVQIAGLSLWLRAQKAWQARAVKPADRPRVRRSNIVCAEPMPGSPDILEEFIASLEPELLGDLVRTVFEKMQLAGEAGTLLKIEEEIRDAINTARKEWLKQQEDLLTREDSSKEEFFDTAEQQVIDALRAYAEQADADSYQRRLFADDAARGFAFIDLCRKRYDAVVMNPPFGLPTASVEKYAKERFEKTWQDIYASFFERTLQLTGTRSGFVGAITPKSFYHAKGFRGLRTLLKESGNLKYSVDIGGGVLDAAVEVCFSILESCPTREDAVALFCNLVSCEKLVLAERVHDFTQGISNSELTLDTVPVSVGKDAGLPNEMLPYRFPDDLLQLLRSSDSFEATAGSSVVGITTFDNERFIRLRWETAEISHREKAWLPVAMGGGWDPFYSEFNLVVKWKSDAAEMRANELRRYDTTARTMQSQRFWLRSGLTFSKISTLGFSTQPFPANSIFTSVGFCIFYSQFDHWTWLGYFNSKPVCCLMSLFSADRHWHSNSVAFLPVPDLMAPEVGELAKKAFTIAAQQLGQSSETAPEFLHCEMGMDFKQKSSEYQELTSDLAKQIAQSFRLSEATLDFLTANAIYAERSFSVPDIDLARRRLAYFLGTAFGRWDIRYATGERQPPELPDPFDPLPVCPPGMLQNAEGLPAEPKDVPADYPLRISWPGILVDDENHPQDIVARVEDALQVIWKDRWESIEQEACEILGVRNLRDYFNKPAKFFADHLKRYSKSRRQAPIYWPLSTKSGSYTLWIYYHRLTDQTLSACVNDFIEPKIEQSEREQTILKQKLQSGTADKNTNDEIGRLGDLIGELKDLQAELLRVDKLPYRPNLNDGVSITAAPLCQCFGLPAWNKKLKETWQKMETGEYDWAHLSYSIWPDRVKEKCKHDKSLAIAHGLESVYIEPPAKPKKKAAKKKAKQS
jgi:hypothetical protein